MGAQLGATGGGLAPESEGAAGSGCSLLSTGRPEPKMETLFMVKTQCFLGFHVSSGKPLSRKGAGQLWGAVAWGAVLCRGMRQSG